MKQLSALGARRHAFFRSPRRMRPLGGRLDESDILASGPYSYYGGNLQSECDIPFDRRFSADWDTTGEMKCSFIVDPYW